MNDLKTLTDAFSELERQADAVALQHPYERTAIAAPASRRPLVLVAATVVAVAGLATGGALLARGHDVPRTSTGGSESVRIPTSPAELGRRFGEVLGRTATFSYAVLPSGTTITILRGQDGQFESRTTLPPGKTTADDRWPSGVAGEIDGQFLVHGVPGAYRLRLFRTDPSTVADCGGAAACTTKTLADGSTLAVGRTSDGKVVTYRVSVVHPDGVELIFSLDNTKGSLGPERPAAVPPLTTDQMVSIVLSPRW